MKKHFLSYIIVAILMIMSMQLEAQVGISTDNSAPNASAMLDVKSTTKGFLLPRLTTMQRITLGSIATAGLVVYDTDLDKLYFHDGTTWNDVSTGNLWTRNGTNTYVTNTGDNVGIGTTSPGYVTGASKYLSVSTPGLGGNQIASFELKGTSGTTFLPVTRLDFLSHSTIGIHNIARIETRITNSQAEGELLFYTNGGALTERMRIDENGNVGIGATAPGQKLTVDGTFGILEGGASPTNHTIFQGGTQLSNITYTLPLDDGSSGEMLTTDGVGVLAWTPAESPLTISNGLTRATNTVKLGGNLTESTTITQDAAESLIFTNSGTGETSFNLAGTGDFRIEDNGSAFFTATDGGNIGIGATAPGQKLTVDGTFGILEGGASPTNHTIFQGGAQSANITYTLPVNDGNSGQMLTTDGSGVLGWDTPVSGNGSSGRVAFWWNGSGLTSNSELFWDDTHFRLGIGVSNPGQKLTVAGTIQTTSGGVMFPDGTTQTTAASNNLHTIGESYGGGIVFYVYDGGRHGLIAATADHPTAIRWNSAPSDINTMALANGVGSGKANTTIIISSQGYGDGASYAARICNEYWATAGGVTYGDWYLPSKHELNLLYLQKAVVGGFTNGYYWSSCEYAEGFAWDQYFSDGTQSHGIKYTPLYVRAIRAF